MKTISKELEQELRDDLYSLLNNKNVMMVLQSEERKKQIVEDCIKDLRMLPDSSLDPEYWLTYGYIGHIPLADLIFNHLTEEELQTWEYNYVSRYVVPHKQTYDQALQEVKNGKKKTHWMWWIFPQMKGLGKSERSRFYGILNRKQAKLFLEHPILGKNLCEITQAVLDSDKNPYEIFGADVIKFRSCMLLFASLEGAPAVFKRVLSRNRWK
ncbi:DUF1810 domain-containing protein [Prevotellamassilia timonensis]|uniref:DUF1810 domain-containing protein n=1 Tax=Prevotellamassilia timonensis TaxID=1852370 RepID=UPI003FEFC432